MEGSHRRLAKGCRAAATVALLALVGWLLPPRSWGDAAVRTAGAQRPPERIAFSRGAHSAQVSGSVVRGEVAGYLLGARAGQRMQVRIRSIEGNAGFQLYPPRSRRALAGAGEGEDARSWSGRLPASGDYLVVVASARGNASYVLHVTIR